MLPAKLEKLPRAQKLRKICGIFAGAEKRLLETGTLSDGEYLSALCGMLALDARFSPAAQKTFEEAAASLKETAGRRPINTVKHLLLMETGRAQADWDFTIAGGGLDPGKRQIFPGMRIFLEDIRSPFNIGSIFRASESFGVEEILLSPLCADPRHPRGLRAAMGCVEILPYRTEELSGLKGQPLFALETGGTDLSRFSFPEKGVMLVGNEELGLGPQALSLADASLGRASIPLYGAKGSLNVSAAFAIAIYAWARRLRDI